MEYFFSNQFTWLSFFVIGAVLLVLYFLLRFLQRMLIITNAESNIGGWVDILMGDLLILFEPVAIILLGSIFIFINPPFHGLLVGLAVFVGYNHIRNYMSGRFVHLDRSVNVGKRLKTKGIEGIISRLGNLGLYLQTDSGPHRINYATLLENGYTLVSGEDMGGFCHLRIKLTDEEKKHTGVQRLFDLLMTTPYVDWNHQPQILPIDSEADSFEAKFLLKDEKYIYDLRRLMKEWGYLFEDANGKPDIKFNTSNF